MDSYSEIDEPCQSISLDNKSDFSNVNIKESYLDMKDHEIPTKTQVNKDYPLQMRSGSKNISPYLIVEDKGFKNEKFRKYQISLVDEFNEVQLKCVRRFSNFDYFNQRICEKYPYVIIPSLPKKNLQSKIMNMEAIFYKNRELLLNHYLNQVFNHKILKNSKELNKFLNDPHFDEDYFTKYEILKDSFPESKKSEGSGIQSQIFGYFSNFFKPTVYKRTLSQDEIYLNKQSDIFQESYIQFKNLKKYIKYLLKNDEFLAESYENLSNHFQFLKTVEFESFKSKEIFSQAADSFKQINKFNEKTFEKELAYFKLKLYGYVNWLKGANETFKRWNEIIRIFEIVDKSEKMMKDNPKLFNEHALKGEHSKIIDILNKFIKVFNNEIHDFSNSNKFQFKYLMNDFCFILNKLNKNANSEISKLNRFITI